jgi:hypothetical protein
MNYDLIVFILICSVIIYTVLDLVVLNYRIIEYLRRYHNTYYEENIHKMTSGGLYGGWSFTDAFSEIKDPRIDEFKKERHLKIRNIFISGLVSMIIAISFLLVKHI